MCLANAKWMIILLAFFLPVALSRMFKHPRSFPDVMVQATFTIKVQAEMDGVVYEEKTLTDYDVIDWTGDESLDKSYLVLKFDDKGYNQIKFLFERSIFTGKVKMQLNAKFKPSELFEQISPGDGSVCFKNTQKDVGRDSYSYLCEKEKREDYDRYDCPSEELQSSYTFSVEVDMKRIQAQGFQLFIGSFSSSVDYCRSGTELHIVAIIVGCVVVVTLVIVGVVVGLLIRRQRRPLKPPPYVISVNK